MGKLAVITTKEGELLEDLYPVTIPEGVIDPKDKTPLSNDLHKIKDKEYNKPNYSGLGRVFLKKNIKEGKNILTQDMINKSNSIYIIEYDFDLNGKEITIPEGCVLDFQGGSFSNGMIEGNNTAIKASLTKIFGLDVKLIGSWNIAESYLEWFGLNPNDNSKFINDYIRAAYYLSTKIKLSNGIYYISGDSISLYDNECLYGSNDTIIKYTGTNASDNIYASAIKMYGNNIKIANIKLDGGSVFENKIIVNRGYATGIWCGFYDKEFSGLVVENCQLSNFTLCGIIGTGHWITLKNNKLENIGIGGSDLSVWGGIFLGYRYEPPAYYCSNCIVEGNILKNIGHVGIFNLRTDKCIVKNNIIENIDYIGIANERNTVLTICDNHIYKTVDNGIDAQKCRHTNINNNTCISCGTRVSTETSSSAVASGIFCGDDFRQQESSNNIIQNNTIIGNSLYKGTFFESDECTCGHGIYIHGEYNTIVRNNKIFGIANLKGGNEQSIGMFLQGSNLTIEDNHIEYTSGVGIRVSVEYNKNYNDKFNAYFSLKRNSVIDTEGILFTLGHIIGKTIDIDSNYILNPRYNLQNNAITVSFNVASYILQSLVITNNTIVTANNVSDKLAILITSVNEMSWWGGLLNVSNNKAFGYNSGTRPFKMEKIAIDNSGVRNVSSWNFVGKLGQELPWMDRLTGVRNPSYFGGDENIPLGHPICMDDGTIKIRTTDGMKNLVTE